QGVYRFQPVAPVSVRLTTTVVFRCRPGSTNTERFLSGALAISLRSRSCAATTAQANKPDPARVNPFTLAAKGKMTVEKREECHRKVTAFVVERLHPFSEVEAPTFRDMLFTLNPTTPPTRDCLTNQLIPSWHKIEKLQFVKLGCFAHTLNLAAQSLYSLAIMSQWIAKIRAIVV
ncbi:hypothetical protein F7725_011992, partial [Dissostichus mawsoni]